MIAALLTVVLLAGPAPTDAPAREKQAGPVPSPSLSPDQVVRIQLDALRLNDRPAKDAGIAAAFRFASPKNREATGPLDNFARIVRGPGYLPMIDHRIAGTGPMVIVGEVAAQRVTVVAKDGRAFEYEFQLSKDPATGCWFTDGVIPLTPVKPAPKGVLS